MRYYARTIFNKVFSKTLDFTEPLSDLQKYELEDLYSISRYLSINSLIFNILKSKYVRFTTCINIQSLSEQSNIINEYWNIHKNKMFGNYTFIDAIKIIKETYFIYGDVFIVNYKNQLNEGNLPSYYIVEPVRIATPRIEDTERLNRIFFGIEYDELFYEPVAYYLLKSFPKNNYYKYYITNPYFPEENFQRITPSNIITNHNFIFPEQKRGLPLLFPAFETLARVERINKIDMDYIEVINSLILALKSDRALKTLEGLKKFSLKANNDTSNSYDINSIDVNSPSIIIGSEYPQVISDNRNSRNNMASIKFYLGQIATFLNMPVFLLTGDFSDTNFASAKVAIKDFLNYCKYEVIKDTENIYKHLYKNFVDMLVVNKIIKEADDIYKFKVEYDISIYEETKLLIELIKQGLLEKEDISQSIEI